MCSYQSVVHSNLFGLTLNMFDAVVQDPEYSFHAVRISIVSHQSYTPGLPCSWPQTSCYLNLVPEMVMWNDHVM